MIFDFRISPAVAGRRRIFDWKRREVLTRIARMGANEFNAKAQRRGDAKGREDLTARNAESTKREESQPQMGRGEYGYVQKQTKGTKGKTADDTGCGMRCLRVVSGKSAQVVDFPRISGVGIFLTADERKCTQMGETDMRLNEGKGGESAASLRRLRVEGRIKSMITIKIKKGGI